MLAVVAAGPLLYVGCTGDACGGAVELEPSPPAAPRCFSPSDWRLRTPARVVLDTRGRVREVAERSRARAKSTFASPSDVACPCPVTEARATLYVARGDENHPSSAPDPTITAPTTATETNAVGATVQRLRHLPTPSPASLPRSRSSWPISTGALSSGRSTVAEALTPTNCCVSPLSQKSSASNASASVGTSMVAVADAAPPFSGSIPSSGTHREPGNLMSFPCPSRPLALSADPAKVGFLPPKRLSYR